MCKDNIAAYDRRILPHWEKLAVGILKCPLAHHPVILCSIGIIVKPERGIGKDSWIGGFLLTQLAYEA